jgi:hypothetical protein
VNLIPEALAPLAQHRQFLCYQVVPSLTRPGKTDKFPMSPHTGERVDAHNPANWTTAQHACDVATAWGEGYGVGFVFTTSDPFFFVDIDGCYDGASWSPLALEVASLFPGAAMEVSQSGAGMHIFGMGVAPPHGKKNISHNMEFYTELRFAALTGVGCVGSAATDHTAALYAITEKYFPIATTEEVCDVLSDGPVDEWVGPTDDAELLRRALNSRSAASAFGTRASFADLWECNTEVLSKAFPDPSRLYGESEADAALISHLGFWTGKHGERVERLMLQSGLYREKFDRPDGTFGTYLRRTIANILARPGDVLTDKLPEPPSVPKASATAPIQSDVTGATFLDADGQRAMFNGCVYVQDRHRVLVPGGHLLKPDQFKVAFGGYAFTMDNINQRTTRNAWEAFTESQVLRAPRAETICFKPTEAPAAIIDDAGRTRVNTWWPANVRRTVGDVSPFLHHVEKMLPDERDRAILLSYMAACVQYQGVKFQWAPILQGAEGNGKSTLMSVVSEAVGQHYTHWPKAVDLASDFNGWVADKLFIAVEELKPRDHMKADEIIENLHLLIAGGRGMSVQYKGVDQVSMEICANVMGATNHKGTIRKTRDNARRFCMFYMAQQTKADIERAGMGGDYFPRFYDWLKNRDGWAIVSELLYSYPIHPEFNPAAGANRAPDTSSTDMVISESLGGVEQQIAEVIAQDMPGFMGGWVSSVMLDRLITDTLKMGNRLSHSKRREMLQGMGYILHPGLSDGRVNNPVQPDGRKPQLFVLAGSPAAQIVGAAEIARAYTIAQSSNPFKVPT